MDANCDHIVGVSRSEGGDYINAADVARLEERNARLEPWAVAWRSRYDRFRFCPNCGFRLIAAEDHGGVARNSWPLFEDFSEE